MEIGPIRRIIKVQPEPFPWGHPENDPEEPSPLKVPMEPELVPVERYMGLECALFVEEQ
jgi:hypothetical protein